MHKVLFAVGGTGGHLFPAQALARDLRQSDPPVEVLFAGGRLATNPYFDQSLFPYREVASRSPSRGSLMLSLVQLTRGVRQSLLLIKEFKPSLVIGFGSFYSFPLLVAARLKKIPYLLVESNAIPGKVNRLFSASAKSSLLQFDACKQHLKGKCELADLPIWASDPNEKTPTKEEALAYYGLEKGHFTLLVFGGSQGAMAINDAVSRLEVDFPIQVIHFSGGEEDLAKRYHERGIKAVVKQFEDKMEYAWKAADLAICRSGASTLREVMAYRVPAILVPWPGATDQHQLKNAKLFANEGASQLVLEKELKALSDAVHEAKQILSTMQGALKRMEQNYAGKGLAKLVHSHLEEIQ